MNKQIKENVHNYIETIKFIVKGKNNDGDN